MSTVTIEINRDKLPPHTDEEFEQWVKYAIGQFGGISTENPLWQHELEGRVTAI
ncbi:MAG: hypothetical protein AB9Q22_10025 [Candidatus Reddybacter sp.]